jgi:hypothetical protein
MITNQKKKERRKERKEERKRRKERKEREWGLVCVFVSLKKKIKKIKRYLARMLLLFFS